MRKIKIISLTLAALLVFGQCQEYEPVQPATKSGVNALSGVSTPGKSGGLAGRIDPYPLNWEVLDYMPTPPGMPAVLVPWASGASRQFTKEKANDYRKANGWELLYNTFNTTQMQDQWYFILYNKYRGLIRMYYYVPSSANFITSSNIVHKLGIEGAYASQSPMMNFAAQPVVDVGVKSPFASVAEPWQVARSTWYLLEHELAYDAAVSGQNYNSFSFIWPVRSNQITQVQLNGNIDGTLKGRVDVPGFDFTINSSVTTNRAGNLTIGGSSDTDKLSALGQAFLNGAKSALQKAGAGIVSGILSGILGKNSATNEDNVNLKLQATVKMTGTLTSDFLVGSTGFAIPGYNQTNTVGFSPAYNAPLGVFYISNKPTVKETVYVTPQTGPNGEQLVPRRQYVYQPEPSSFQMIYNPTVTAIANISDVLYEVVVNDPGMSYQVVGAKEDMGGYYYYTGGLVGVDQTSAGIVGVRVTFKVTPNDGSPAVTTSKTFAANKVTTEVVTPPGEDQW